MTRDPESVLERIRGGRTDLVVDLLGAGLPATTESGGASILAWCSHHGDVTAVRLLVERGAPLASLGPNLDLSGAAFHGHWQLVEYLVEQGADVNHSDPINGETPLHAALCKANRPAYDHVVEVLLRAGADPRRATTPGAATVAFMRDCRTRGETPLHRAAAYGSERSVRMLLDAGAEREARDEAGDTPLSWASWHLRPPAILRLLCFGEHVVHPGNDATYDHGSGWGQMDAPLRGRPLPR